MRKFRKLEGSIVLLTLLLAFMVFAAPPSLLTAIGPSNQSNTSTLFINLTCEFSDPESDPINITFKQLNLEGNNPIWYDITCQDDWYCNPNATLNEGGGNDRLGVGSGKGAVAKGYWDDVGSGAGSYAVCEKGEGIFTDSGYYYYNQTNLTFAQQNDSCNNLNGSNPQGWHLAVPQSSDENVVIAELCEASSTCYIAGVQTNAGNPTWIWDYNRTFNTTLQNNSQTWYQWNLSSGIYNWSCESCDDNLECSPLYQLWFNNSFLGLNFNFLDEVKNYLWTGINISVELIPLDTDISGQHGNATQGNISFDNALGGFYTVHHSSNQSVTRGFFTEGSNSNITIYVLNNTYNFDEVTINVISNINEPLERALVKTYKFSEDIDDYKLVESTLTDFEGKTKQSLILNKFYQVVIEYPIGTTVFISDPTLLFSNELNLVVNTAEDGAANFFEFQNVSYNFNFSNSTKNFYFSFVGSDEVESGCLRVYEWENNDEKLRNETCIDSNIGVMSLFIDPANGTTWTGKAFVTIDSEEYLVDSISKIFGVSNIGGTTGIIIIVFLTITLCGLFFFSPTMALIIAPLPLLIGSLIKLIPIPTPVSLSVYVVFIILALVVGRNR